MDHTFAEKSRTYYGSTRPTDAVLGAPVAQVTRNSREYSLLSMSDNLEQTADNLHQVLDSCMDDMSALLLPDVTPPSCDSKSPIPVEIRAPAIERLCNVHKSLLRLGERIERLRQRCMVT